MPPLVSPCFGILKLPQPSAHRIMRLMANHVLMRIDSFIKLQLCARCFPLPEPRRFKGKQDMAWGRLGVQGQQSEGRTAASSGVQIRETQGWG